LPEIRLSMKPLPRRVTEPNPEPVPAESPTGWLEPARVYWSSIPLGLRLLLLAEGLTLIGTVVFLWAAFAEGWSVFGSVTDLELLLLAVTIIVLTLLTEHSTRRSAVDVNRLIQTVVSENRTLIEENRAHWSEQRTHLDTVVGSLGQVAQLMADLIAAVRKLDESQRAVVKLQEADLKAREEALRQEIQTQKPKLSISIRKWEGKVIKHFVVSVRNEGPPGSDLDATFVFGAMRSADRASVVSQGAPCVFDFGDINNYPDSGELVVTCEVASATKAHRYRFSATYDYSRNKGFWGSSPTLTRRTPAELEGKVLY